MPPEKFGGKPFTLFYNRNVWVLNLFEYLFDYISETGFRE